MNNQLRLWVPGYKWSDTKPIFQSRLVPGYSFPAGYNRSEITHLMGTNSSIVLLSKF
jgi:hypothetical protein